MAAYGKTAPAEDPAAARIREAASRGTLSHALLFTGAGDRMALARLAAAAMECTAPGERPCGVCPACRKVFRDIHPDVVTVRDDTHRQIAADVVRSIRQDAFVRPNEGARKVYLFPDCALLSERDQNILLKVVEEGPPYAAFLFCAENAAQVLQTLRSRCVELKLRPPAEHTAAEADAKSDGAAEGAELCRRTVRVAQGRRGAAAEYAVRLERKRLTREELAGLLAWCREAFAAALLWAYGSPPDPAYRDIAPALAGSLTRGQIMSVIELLQRYLGDCASPVGPGHVLGALAAELEGLL